MSEPTNPFFMTRNQLVCYSKRLEEELADLKSEVDQYKLMSEHKTKHNSSIVAAGIAIGVHPDVLLKMLPELLKLTNEHKEKEISSKNSSPSV
jgi:hypothetical protein